MCGFAGVVVWDDRYRTSPETLARMSAAIAHRGPDGEGVYFNHESEATADRPQCALAFRRLAILDPDPRSNQPFTIGCLTLVFNGEIYNFRELRNELSQLRPDYAWRTSGDTEVLLLTYDVWREKCVDHLNGMFAFAVWNEREQSLFLARDRMGQKPLFVAAPSWPRFPVLAFASEIGALRALGWFVRDVNQEAIAQYLRFGYTGHDSAFTNCFAFGRYWNAFAYHPEAGMAMSAAGMPYFDPNMASVRPADPVALTAELVNRAVQRQLVSDVPLGVFLSGGIDSSVIAACARRFGRIKTFSIRFDDPRYDESAYAAAVAKHLDTDHHTFRVAPRAIDDLPKLSAAFGTPFGDSSALPTHYLARETRRHVTVALSGDGGDELFGGYDRYRAMRLARRLGSLAGSLLASLGRITRTGHPKSTATRIGRFLSSLDKDPGQRYESYLRLFDDAQIDGLLRTPAASSATHSLSRQFDVFGHSRDDVETALALDRITYLPDDLLTKVDRCSMLHGLEVRSPFMDHELVQFAAGLTTNQLLKGGPKRMLREAFAKDLPDFVFKRKKMGFAVPIGEWFRGELRSVLRDNLFAADSFASAHFNPPVVERLVEEHEQKRVDHSQRLYALLMLELWWRQQK